MIYHLLLAVRICGDILVLALVLVMEHPLRLLDIGLEGHLVEHSSAGPVVLGPHGVYVAR